MKILDEINGGRHSWISESLRFLKKWKVPTRRWGKKTNNQRFEGRKFKETRKARREGLQFDPRFKPKSNFITTT